MWRFYFTLMLFLLLTALLLVIPASATLRILLAGLLLLFLVVTVAIGAFTIRSQFFVKAFCKGDPESNLVAITFDDGPHPVRTPEILQILDRFNSKASFFLIGKRMEGNEGVVRKVHAAGHTIGNHSYSHSNRFPFFPGSRIEGEVRDTNQLIEGITGTKVRYFRPPFGVTNPRIRRGLRNSGLQVIGWSIRSFDTRGASAEKTVRRITRGIGGGDIVLLHETSENILQILEQLIPRISEMGFSCVSLDQMGIPNPK